MKTTKAERAHRFYSAMQNLGFNYDEAAKLRRIEMTLQRWSEHECNGNIQREGDQCDGKPRWHSGYDSKGYRIADREAGALRRLQQIVHARNQRHAHPLVQDEVVAYHQGDPRGCSLYLLRKTNTQEPRSDIREGEDIGSIYSRGLAVCI